MKRIFNYVWKYKILIVIPTIAMLFGIAIDMLNPYLAKLMIDRVITKKEFNLLFYILLGIGSISISRALLIYVKEYIFDKLSAKISEDIKQDLFDHIQSLPFTYFDNINTGELMSRIGEDVDNIWKTIAFALRLFIENAIYFITASVILFYLNWQLAFVCVSIMLPIAYLAMKLEKEVGESYGKLSDQGVILNTTAQENIAGVRLVKAFAREKHEILKFLNLNKENYKLNIEQNDILAKYFPPIEFLTNISIVLMVCVGGILVIKNKLTLGTLVAFNGYIWMLIWPMRMLGWLSNILAQTSASSKKIFAILDTESSIKSPENSISIDNLKGNIEFKNVSFSYGKEIILKNINLKVNEGSTVAIMGTTGSGKSSLINLIGRYYDVSTGDIFIDGKNLKDLNLESYRSQMSVVSQDTFLFSDSIEANIKFGKAHATMSELSKACSDACALDFIENLPQGFHTIIGERGIGLSGGQKQRLSIARALVRNCKILILDDATSALDVNTEYSLLKNLNNRNENATTIIIAHRISAVKNADEIIFMDNGEIVERGTHTELLKKQGKYYEIYCEQFKDFDNMEEEVS